MINSIDFERKKVVILTAYRRENWEEPMNDIFAAIRKLVEENQ